VRYVMSRKKGNTVSTTQSVEHPLPPGPEVIVDTTGAQVAVPMEETVTAEEQEAKPVKRASGPRKLKPNEVKVVKHFMETYIGETDPITKTVSFEELHKDMKPWFQPSMRDNVVGRGIFNAVYDDETKMLTGVQLTELGAELYRKLNGSDAPATSGRKGRPKGVVTEKPNARTFKYDAGLRLRILVDDNPRQVSSHGYHSFNLYENGMTYDQYLNTPFDSSLMSKKNTEFSGPKRWHWDNDLMHGYIGLYYADQPEFLEDGSPNPRFWYVNMRKNQPPEEVTTPGETTETAE